MSDKKGTILYVGGFELPDKNAAAHRVLNNARMFRELGYEVVFCGSDKEITKKNKTVVDVIDGFESIPIGRPSTSWEWVKLMLSFSHYRKMFKKYKNIQMVVCYNLHALPLLRLMNYCKKRGIKIVYDCTEWRLYEDGYGLGQIIKRLNAKLCMNVLVRKCDGLIAISSHLVKFYDRYIKNIVVVPPLVNIIDEKYNIEPSKNNAVTTFVYSGNPCSAKESLGDVVCCLSNIHRAEYMFNIVGITLEQFIEMYGVRPDETKFKFYGIVPHLKAVEIVRESDLAVIVRPRVHNNMMGFPTKFVEAISCGIPVIANDTSDLKNYLFNGKNGYLIDEGDMSKAFEEILSAKVRPVVNREIFDYHNWKDEIEEFLDAVMCG